MLAFPRCLLLLLLLQLLLQLLLLLLWLLLLLAAAPAAAAAVIGPLFPNVANYRSLNTGSYRFGQHEENNNNKWKRNLQKQLGVACYFHCCINF